MNIVDKLSKLVEELQAGIVSTNQLKRRILQATPEQRSKLSFDGDVSVNAIPTKKFMDWLESLNQDQIQKEFAAVTG